MPRLKQLLPILLGISLLIGSLFPKQAQAQYNAFAYWATVVSVIRQEIYGLGENTSYQIGNNSTTTPVSPTLVSSTADWSIIAPGTDHTCGIRGTSNTAYCWGTALDGRLGNNSITVTATTPQPIYLSPNSYTNMSAGDFHTCGIQAGTVYCWGNNGSGRLGTGTSSPTYYSTPTAISGGGTDWTKVSAGSTHSCGIRASNVYCWGADTNGQLGNDSPYTASAVPVLVSNTYTSWTDISSGNEYSCGVHAGKGACWGIGTYGVLGFSDTGGAPLPSDMEVGVGPHVGWTKIVAGYRTTCGLISSTIYCWGWNQYGQLGTGTLTVNGTSLGPYTPVAGGWTDWTDVAVGMWHACGIRNGYGYCWGDNTYGQLGISVGPMGMPQQISISTATSISSISAGSGNSCAVRGGNVYCWGYNQYGEVGTNTSQTRYNLPVLTSGTASNWTRVSTGGSTSLRGISCGIRSGAAYCWGSSQNGAIGNGTTGTAYFVTPSLVSGGFTDWTEISANDTSVCGIRAGTAYCWGIGNVGQMGNGATTTTNATPQLVSGGWTDWTKISVSGSGWTNCGIRSGIAYCWGGGGGTNYQKGDASQLSRTTPTLVLGGWSDWTQISVGIAHACGIRSTGIAYCWGFGANGRLGNGTTNTAQSPSLVLGGFTNWTKISAGYQNTCGIRGGMTYCWGPDSNGALGNNMETGIVLSPTLVSGGYTDWTDITTGMLHACGVRNNVGYCWGYHAYGQTGVGIDFSVPNPMVWSTYNSLTSINSSAFANTTFVTRVSP